jgi:hypothetical protein
LRDIQADSGSDEIVDFYTSASAKASGWRRRRGTAKVIGDERPCGRTVMAAAFTTAIEAWDKRWATAEGRADWLDPEPD